MSVIDPAEVAVDAGLRHVDPLRLPIVRRPRGHGFRYLDKDGRPAPDEVRRRIDELAIPPAWQDVRIAASDVAHIQAVGIDEAGRTQYRYHPAFRAAADARKFARLEVLAPRLARLRRSVADAIERDARDEHGDTPLVIALIDQTLLRVGSERYAQANSTFGASTLRARHVSSCRTGARLRFVAKGDVERDVTVTDERLALAVLERRDRCSDPDDRVFVGPDGGVITGAIVSDRLSRWAATPMTAKELRTWGASTAMTHALCDSASPSASPSSDDPELAAYDEVAERLGNTRAVARSAYVAPRVVDAWHGGELQDLWRRSRSSSRFSRAEQVLRKLLL